MRREKVLMSLMFVAAALLGLVWPLMGGGAHAQTPEPSVCFGTPLHDEFLPAWQTKFQFTGATCPMTGTWTFSDDGQGGVVVTGRVQ